VRYYAFLKGVEDGHKAILKAWETVKPWLSDGREFELVISIATRSSEQNAKLHAELSEIAHSVEWAGKRRDVETWKRLLTAAWLRAKGEPIEMLPSLDGHGVDIVFRRTSQLTKSECADLIEYVMAWKAT
jgi:hypothetical protein